jgi:YaaC-like Protein
MIIPLEDRWGLLTVLEQEHGSREALRKLYADGDLTFEVTALSEQQNFIDSIAPRYVSQSLKQSKEFFRQAETSSWIVKPLLLYYGMLACAKACLVFAIPDFVKSAAARTHGISTDNVFRERIDIATETLVIRGNGIYPFLRRILGLKAFPANTTIPVEELLVRLPEIDRWYRLLFGKGAPQEHWFAINGNIMVQDQAGVRIGFNLTPEFYQKIVSRMPESLISNFDINPFKTVDDQERVGLLGKLVWPTQEAALSIGVPPVMTMSGDGNSCNVILPLEINGVLYDISEVELFFLVMFYMSSIARYQPHLWLQMHAGTEDFSALLTQTLLSTSENRFLALVWSRLYYTMSLPLVKRP